jgi:CHAT domain-containing protein
MKPRLWSVLIAVLLVGVCPSAAVRALDDPPVPVRAPEPDLLVKAEAPPTDTGVSALMDQAQKAGAAGFYIEANRLYQNAYASAADPRHKRQAAAAIGNLYLRAKQADAAQPWITYAYEQAAGEEREQRALAMGNLMAALGDNARARALYQTAQKRADPFDRAAAGINLLRLSSRVDLKKAAAQINRDIAQVREPQTQAALYVQLAHYAALASDVADNQAIALSGAQAALTLARQTNARRLQLSAYEILSDLYERHGRRPDALKIIVHAINIAKADTDQDFLIRLYGRSGRIHQALGQPSPALAAYRRAVKLIDEIRIDIPITFADGRSSFRETLEPIYLGLAQLILDQDDGKNPANPALREAVQAIEGLKQSELQDYLGDRCAVEGLRLQHQRSAVPQGLAVLYPIIFPDHLDMLVMTATGIHRARTSISAVELRFLVSGYAQQLRNYTDNSQANAQALYRILFAPIQPLMQSEGIARIVVVPDGVLRLLPFAALHDGQNYLVEKYALSVTPTLDLVHLSDAPKVSPRMLIAGLSNPGPVVDVLARQYGQAPSAGATRDPEGNTSSSCTRADGLVTPPARGVGFATGAQPDGEIGECPAPGGTPRALRLAGEDREAGDRDPSAGGTDTPGAKEPAKTQVQREALRESLRLPGVIDEVAQLRQAARADVLLDQDFSFARFGERLESGRYDVLHIASHGVFGSNNRSSYVLSYDKLITINALQTFLKSEKLAAHPLSLLTFSACETAEGDDRAPLGFAGVALKARAKSALGTLWSVSDDAAKTLMPNFYAHMLGGQMKTDALRAAQIRLMGQKEFNHPFFWAPFILVGSWQ